MRTQLSSTRPTGHPARYNLSNHQHHVRLPSAIYPDILPRLDLEYVAIHNART
ncbi:hypothetical protein BDR05DRAFT_963221 [Suillus weaverae]|nr:hypothetical protein BDR05DRAFT_963221 [Suillus weaverae]